MNAPWAQNEFAMALVDRSRPVPEETTSWTAPRPLKRFNVYRGNVAGALGEALAVRYPVVRRLVGAEFFQAMAREYGLANPPHSPVLIHYGADFADFIAGFEPAKSVPYLSDVARLDSAHWEAYHAEVDRLRAIPRGTGGNFYLTQAARVSKRFAAALVTSTLEGQTRYNDAFRMLGFSKLSTFKELGRSLGVGVA